MTRKIIPVLLVLLLSGCCLYHKPKYSGRVVDIETGEPIEGVLVATRYDKTIYAVVDTTTSFVGSREVLTDKNGNFRIPSYTTLIAPFSWDDDLTYFTFYKPGYGSLETGGSHGDCFKGTCYEEGFEMSSEVGSVPMVMIKYRIGTGYIALPPVKSRNQHLKAMPSLAYDDPQKKFPILYDMINSERVKYGLGTLGKKKLSKRQSQKISTQEQITMKSRATTIQKATKSGNKQVVLGEYGTGVGTAKIRTGGGTEFGPGSLQQDAPGD